MASFARDPMLLPKYHCITAVNAEPSDPSRYIAPEDIPISGCMNSQRVVALKLMMTVMAITVIDIGFLISAMALRCQDSRCPILGEKADLDHVCECRLYVGVSQVYLLGIIQEFDEKGNRRVRSLCGQDG